jgi:hypothetical protein
MGGEGVVHPLRQVIFWLHPVTGVVAGLVIGVMSVTGVLLAFERQIIAFAERNVRTVQPPTSGVSRLALDALMTTARAAVPKGKLTGVMLRADPTATVVVNFGREQSDSAPGSVERCRWHQQWPLSAFLSPGRSVLPRVAKLLPPESAAQHAAHSRRLQALAALSLHRATMAGTAEAFVWWVARSASPDWRTFSVQRVPHATLSGDGITHYCAEVVPWY